MDADKRFACDICEKTFTRKESLYTHKNIHTGDKPYSCDICEKVFTARQSLYSHKKYHTGEKPYHCDICEKTFAALGKLRLHNVSALHLKRRERIKSMYNKHSQTQDCSESSADGILIRAEDVKCEIKEGAEEPLFIPQQVVEVTHSQNKDDTDFKDEINEEMICQEVEI